MPLPQLPTRSAESHKGDFGRAILIGGSRGMSGAIALAGIAALRSGAGLVTLAVPELCLDAVAAYEPSYMTLALPCDAAGRLSAAAFDELVSRCASATCVACGPGMGLTDGTIQLVTRLYTTLACPMVVDADALNALASQPFLSLRPAGPRVLTPHPGEFRRLVGLAQGQGSRADLTERAAELASSSGAVVILKGHRSVITDGRQLAENRSGNPGMATGGSGDVLTGIVTGLICQGLDACPAARLAAHLHGRAGDLAADRLGQVSMMASDLLRFLPAAFCEHQALGSQA